MSEVLICGLDQAGIDKLKNKHGLIYTVTIQDEAQKLVAICKEPDSTVMSAVNVISRTDEMKGTLLMYNSCVLEADLEIKNREILQMRVAAAIAQRVADLNTSVKNL